METVRILFNTKFCQTHLDSIIFEYWDKSFDAKTEKVIFDLSLLEWINIEEIAFLFAWIRNINNERKKVEIWMPYPYDIFDTRLYQDIEELKKVKSLLKTDDVERIKRRKKRSIFLLGVWRILERVGVNPAYFLHTVDGQKYKADEVRELFSHLVIPFTVISLQKVSSQFSNTFTDVVNGLKTSNAKENEPVAPFDLNPTIIKRLETFNCYSPFESKIISHIITKELFANSLIHSNISNKNNGIEECYFTLALHNQWDDLKAKGDNFLNQFILEKDADALDFYKDKKEILKEMRSKLQASTPSDTLLSKYEKSEEADLKSFEDKPIYFQNKSFLEFTFLDFGDGINNTLEKKFQGYIEVDENKKTFKTVKTETQILEYAFYSDSSRNQYDARLEHPELFPRGLYFLVDMVRRYKGLLVVRSGDGKIVYDFSDKIYLKKQGKQIIPFLEPTTTVKEAIRIIKSRNAHFEGTLVSIVLPEKKKEDLSYEPVRADNKELYRDIYLSKTDTENLPSETFKPETYEYISMLFLYERVITTIKPKELEKTKGFDSYIYIELLEELKKYSSQKCIIFIDFEFYPRTDNIQQLLFYLTNSPHINEYSKAVIINLVDEKTSKSKELQKEVYSVLSEFKVNLFAKDNEPHIFRPIPCVNFDFYNTEKLVIKDINWIGVKSVEDEKQLDKLFIGDESQLKIKNILNNESLGGSVFADNSDFKYAIFTTSLELIEKFKEARQTEIVKLINALITDGSKPIKNFKEKGIKEHFIFQASKGSFQIKYLSLYETLHNKYLAKYLAKRLLDNYITKIEDNSQFNKIITVTVSSQLIGVAIRDLIKDDPAYSFLKSGDDDTMESCPSLIMLSSYYSFEDEKPFTKIKENDNVLIVNDVISTGSLVYKLLEKIGKKDANVTGVMSIADCRIEKVDKDEEDDCDFKLLKNKPLFTLVGYPAKEIEIRKYKEKEFALNALNKACCKKLKQTDIDVKRINPLLNTVVELSDEYAEKQRILFEDPNELIPDDKEELKIYQAKFFKIGHFEQNISHNGYLTNMKILFSDKEGLRIIKEIKKKIDSEYQTKLYNRNIDDASKLYSIISLAEQIANREIANSISTEIKQVLETIINDPIKPDAKAYSYKPDFIFYPIFSGIENFSHKLFHEVFNTDYENIIGLQRFDTDKGWRFPFPPKRFNNITKGKHILIFDSGALTGESLVQMIDSISFLDVARIDVISVVGRIEDYNREFFSRIKSLKVKSLHDYSFDSDIDKLPNKIEVVRNKVSFSNLNIIFGINFHIPVFSSKSSCPFCEELVELNSYQEKYSDKNFPEATKKYIEKRKIEIGNIDLNHDPNASTPDYIPYVKKQVDKLTQVETIEYDIVSIFLMRDKLGKIDSYRFYKEYYKPFDDDIIKHLGEDIFDVKKKEVLLQLELILICILHEPKLFKVHKDLLVNIHDQCKQIIEDVLNGKVQLRDTIDNGNFQKKTFNFYWSNYSFLRLAAMYFEDDIHHIERLESFFNFSSDDVQGLNYLSYIFVKNLKPFKSHENNKALKTTLTVMDDIFQKEQMSGVYKKQTVKEVIRKVVRYIEPVNTEDVNQALYCLKMFFKNEHSSSDHDHLIRLISDLKISIGSKVETEDIDNIKNTIIAIWTVIDEKVFSNIKTIKKHKATCDNPKNIYINLIDGSNSVYTILEELESKYTIFKGLFDVDESAFEERVVAIMNFKNVLFNQLQLKHFLTDKWFNIFSAKYFCCLEDCINEAIRSEPVRAALSIRNSFSIVPVVNKQTIINAHPDFIHFGLVEMIRNSVKRSENEGATLQFEISEEEKGAVVLRVKQDKPFIPNEGNHYSGIENEIRPIFEMFCGKENVFIPEPLFQSPTFEIKIVFNKKELKTI